MDEMACLSRWSLGRQVATEQERSHIFAGKLINLRARVRLGLPCNKEENRLKFGVWGVIQFQERSEVVGDRRRTSPRTLNFHRLSP